MKLTKYALGAALMSMTLVSCGDSGGSGNSTATTAYSIQNGQCYNGNSQVVDYNYCTSLSNYYQVNSYCYNPTGARVDDSYCRNNGYLNLQPRQCNDGKFFMPRQGRMHEVNCRNRNCRDNLMFDDRGRPIHCR
ncbi:hypothetical protein B9G69_007870 [Bdellovibrio sp. SKB1291214]|uniref:hypothetical protein n=1 Tax=Bdellovibrio sp. SKB1291214 TaxID=1732569 RepID=UPI000B518C84|nr:hypothetical protein [Bdellovibrio sp. SKB1291214]UYL10491.1 hypothetical protein B9G69_007870 [Bdellovibrio sp. SKB1291214]